MNRRKHLASVPGLMRRALPILALVILASVPVRVGADSPGQGSTMHGQGSMPGMQHPGMGQMHGGTGSPAAASSPSTAAYEAVLTKMHDDQQIGFTGDADSDFARHMILHHQGAIDMAQVELQYGRDPTLREMAEKIIADQQREIDMFRKWLDSPSASTK